MDSTSSPKCFLCGVHVQGEDVQIVMMPGATMVSCLPCIKKLQSDSCYYCNTSNAVKRCARCKQAKYCNKECQVKDWKEHSQACLEL